MNTDTEIDMTTDQALISALTPRTLGGIELQPYSLVRHAIATDLCYPDPGLCNWFITVWVCTLTEPAALKARESIIQARSDAFKWAEGQGYSTLHFEPIRDAYVRINREFSAIAGVRIGDASEDGQKKTDGERPGS